MSACATAGASLCSIGLTASGVPSLSPNPVPPDVRMRSTFSVSHHFVMMPCIASIVEGMSGCREVEKEVRKRRGRQEKKGVNCSVEG